MRKIEECRTDQTYREGDRRLERSRVRMCSNERRIESEEQENGSKLYKKKRRMSKQRRGNWKRMTKDGRLETINMRMKTGGSKMETKYEKQ